MSRIENKQNSERIRRIIEICKSVEDRGTDPFSLDVDDIIKTLNQFFPEWESPEEMAVDAEAIQCLASVIQNQGDWVKYRSTSLYTDPFLLEEKIQKLKKEDIASIFMHVWNPLVEMEQLSLSHLADAIEYWNNLIPINERLQKDKPTIIEAESATREELIRLKILAETTFREKLESFWQELKNKSRKNDRILYWNFIGARTYNETLERAYMTSFLVTYGYATLEIKPLEEEVFIIPFKEPQSESVKESMVSVPISITFDDWTNWKEGKLT
ncbi:MAG: hypothetical protein P8X91_03220 [Candidatus Bathyarchaeota archaeon]